MSANGVPSRAASQGEADIEARLPGPALPPAGEAPSASKDMLLNFCRVFNVITIICSLMSAVALGIGIAVHLHEPDQVNWLMEQFLKGRGLAIKNIGHAYRPVLLHRVCIP